MAISIGPVVGHHTSVIQQTLAARIAVKRTIVEHTKATTSFATNTGVTAFGSQFEVSLR